MTPHKTLSWLLLLALLLTFGSGCGAINKLMGKSDNKAKQGQQEQKKDKQKIGVVLSAKNEETPQIKKGLMDAAKKENVELVFLDADKADKKELEQKGKDLKALIIQGGSESKGQEIVNALSKQKPPIIAIDQVSGTKVEGMVVPDYFRMGEMQSEFVKSQLKEGQVVLLQSADPGAEEIVAGIKTSLAQSPSLKLAQTFTSPTKESSPVSAFDDYLKNNPGKVQAVIATDSKLALEAIEVLKKQNLSKKIIMVSAGTHKATVAKIASGELHADVDKSPYLQGMYALQLASNLTKQQGMNVDRTVMTETGETPAKLVPLQLVRPENVAKFQRIYAQPMPQEEEGQDKKQEEKSGDKKQGDKGQDKKQSGDSDTQGKDQQAGQQKGGQQQEQADGVQKALNLAGVSQVREKIRTEITREMLGQDGKVMGTEKEVKEEVRTLPAQLLQAKQQEDKEKDTAGGKGDKQGDKGDKGEGGSEKDGGKDSMKKE